MIATGIDQYQRLFGVHSSATRRLDHGSLPTTARYLHDRGLLAGKTRGEWVTIRCPSHKAGGEVHPSLRVSLADGHFRCMACGARGGDLVALHRLLTGVGFTQAVLDLGACFHD